MDYSQEKYVGDPKLTADVDEKKHIVEKLIKLQVRLLQCVTVFCATKVPQILIVSDYTTNIQEHTANTHNTTQHNTTQHNTTQHNTTQHNTTQHNTRQDKTRQDKTTQQHKTRTNTDAVSQVNTESTHTNKRRLTSPSLSACLRQTAMNLSSQVMSGPPELGRTCLAK